jgi:hypothetical protein
MALKTIWKKAGGKSEVKNKNVGEDLKYNSQLRFSVQVLEACKIKWEQNGRKFQPVHLCIHPIFCGEREFE